MTAPVFGGPEGGWSTSWSRTRGTEARETWEGLELHAPINEIGFTPYVLGCVLDVVVRGSKGDLFLVGFTHVPQPCVLFYRVFRLVVRLVVDGFPRALSFRKQYLTVGMNIYIGSG